MLINALAEAVAREDPPAAQQAAAALAAAFPDDRHLAPAAGLILALAAETEAGDQPWPDAAAATRARHTLGSTLQPDALTLLGTEAAAHWLRARWRALARRARLLPFHGTDADIHAAALWLQARAWDEAASAVVGIESWRRKPQPLAWMVQARWHQAGPDAAWPLLAELAWLAPQRVPLLVAGLPDPRLARLARTFEGSLEATAPDWAWWPAWLLVEQPLLAAPLDAAQTAGTAPAERGFKLLLSLLRLEREGRHHDIVALRRELQALHAELFAAYMRTR
jgi:hypothetical protein